MPALVFDTCCGCIELRTGCLIIGWLELILEIIGVIILALVLAIGGVAASSTVSVHSSMTEYNLVPVDNVVHGVGTVLIVVSVIMLLALAMAMAFTITLLVGVNKNKRGHLLAYMVYRVLFLVLAIIMFFVLLSIDQSAGNIIINLLLFALQIYFVLVVRSYYYIMETNGPAVISTA